MTEQEIDQMQPGMEMDALIHREVFKRRTNLVVPSTPYATRKNSDGTTTYFFKERHYVDPGDTLIYLHATDGFTGMIPNYSTLHDDAMRIVNWNTGNCKDADCFLECWSDGEWFVASRPVGYSDRKPVATCDGRVTGKPSLPLAICRWGLKKTLDEYR